MVELRDSMLVMAGRGSVRVQRWHRRPPDVRETEKMIENGADAAGDKCNTVQ